MKTKQKAPIISESFILNICERLAQDKRVRRTLPVWGRLHIDRQLPFLCLYRRPSERNDEGMERLVMGEASYLITTGQRNHNRQLGSLVTRISSALGHIFGSFLIVEISSMVDSNEIDPTQSIPAKPAFNIIAPESNDLFSTVASLEKALRKIEFNKQRADVDVVHLKKMAPPGRIPFWTKKEATQLGIHYIGIEIAPIFRDRENHQIYPVALKHLQRRFTAALKHCFFEFSHSRTSHFPPHYHAMGRRAMVKAVWEVDRQLAEVSKSFDLLLSVTPVNAEDAWADFKRNRFQRTPQFLYRLRTIEPALLKRMLYKIPIERIEDPIVARLFQEKQEELDGKITLLSDRENPRFLHGSIRLFGGIDRETTGIAEELLRRLPSRTREKSKNGYLNAEEFARRAMTEIEYYRAKYPDFTAAAEVRDDVAGLLVSQGKLLIGQSTRIPASRVEAVLHHEIGTHLVTFFNGRAQPFKQLSIGLAGYDELQEGLAVLAEYISGGLSRSRLRLLAARVHAVRCLIEGASFIDVFRELDQQFDFERKMAFTIAMRVYRGGGLTKDAVYLRGLIHLLSYIKKNDSIETLFLGKFNIHHIPIIKELQWRQVLHPMPLTPRFMDLAYPEKFQRLRTAASIFDLVEIRRAK